MGEAMIARQAERQSFVGELVKALYEKDDILMLQVASSLMDYLKTWDMPNLLEARVIVLKIKNFSKTPEESAVLVVETTRKVFKSATSRFYAALVRQELYHSELILGEVSDEDDG